MSLAYINCFIFYFFSFQIDSSWAFETHRRLSCFLYNPSRIYRILALRLICSVPQVLSLHPCSGRSHQTTLSGILYKTTYSRVLWPSHNHWILETFIFYYWIQRSYSLSIWHLIDLGWKCSGFLILIHRSLFCHPCFCPNDKIIRRVRTSI